MPPPSTSTDPLLTVRAAVVLLLAVIVGVAVGVLTYLVQDSVPAGLLAGLAAIGATTVSAATLIR